MSGLKQFLNELRHRRVLRVAAGYAVVAAGVVEIFDIVTPALGLPERLITVVIVAALVGFPVVIGLTWSLDLTDQGVVAGTPAPANVTPRSHTLSWILICVLSVAVAFLSYKLYWQASGSAAAQAAPLKYGKSVAVLPFQNISGSGQADTYFSDGVAEEILSALAVIDGLRVAARTSSFAFRDGAGDAASIGDALQVSYVLDGSVRRERDRLRVTAQLVNSTTGFNVWSDRFDYQFADVFRVQEQIARSIVGALELELAGDETAQIVRPGTDDTRAYDLYLKGRHLLGARRLEQAHEAITTFERALELDEDYAQAYAGLADAWILIREIGNLPQFEATQRSHTAITQALQINNLLPEAQTSLGLCILGGGDKADAISQFERALELDPDYVDAHLWRANSLRDQGHLIAATQAYNQALSLDPFNPRILEEQALLLAREGRFERAASQLADVAAANSGRLATPIMQSRVALLSGDYDRALAAAERARNLAADDPVTLAALVDAYLHNGLSADAATTLQRARELAPNNETVLLASMNYYRIAGEYEELNALADARLQPIIGNPAFRGTELLYERLIRAATARLLLGESSVALEYLEQAMPDHDALLPRPASVHGLALLAHARALNGDEAGRDAAILSAREAAERARSEGWHGGVLDYAVAAATAASGDHARALEILQRAIDAGWRDFVSAAHHPSFENLRVLRQYQALRD